jgi:hypothetical protein
MPRYDASVKSSKCQSELTGAILAAPVLLDGTHVLHWQLHWVAGWSPADGEYRATVADVYGHAEVMRGVIDSDRLVFESVADPPVRIRLTWELTGPAVVWRNEMSVAGGPWSLVEEYLCTPSGTTPSADPQA